MSRLTEKFGQNATTKEPCYIPAGIGKQEGNPLNEIINKLGRLEDLADEGRLIELPCKVGDTVWVVGTKCLSGRHEKKCGEIALCSDCPLDREMIVFDRIFDWRLFYIIQERECKWDGKLLFVWGETVFATKEEAEAKLAELKGGAE